MEKTCTFCGKSLERKPSWFNNHGDAYCSRECQSQHYKVRFAGKNNPNYQGAGIKHCIKCGKEFKSYQNNRKYCSLECWYGEKIKKICENCGKEFETYRCYKDRMRCCSVKCRGELQAKKYEEKRIKKTCPICGFNFLVNQSNSFRICCSIRCLGLLRQQRFKGEGNPRWLGGTSAYRGVDWDEVRLKVYKRDDFKCRICGEDNCLLHAHHIIPYRISKNNSLDNLITLCPKHHTHEENEYRRYGRPSLTLRREIEKFKG